MTKSVDELYRKLNIVAERLALQQGRQVSMKEALLQLIESMKLEPSDFSWSWRINETSSTEAVPDRSPGPVTRVANRHE